MQASLLSALPKVDTETALTLRRSNSAAAQASSASAAASPSLLSGTVDSEPDSSTSTFTAELGSEILPRSSGLPLGSGHGAHTQQMFHDGTVEQPGPTQNGGASSSYQPVLAIPHTSTAQGFAGPYLWEAAVVGSGSSAERFSRPVLHSCHTVACHSSSPAFSRTHSSSSQPACAVGQSSSSELRTHTRASKFGRGLMQHWGSGQGRAVGPSAAACSGGASHMARRTSPRSHHTSWKLHALGSNHTTAETLDSEVVESSQSISDNELDNERRSSNGQASSSSGSPLGSESLRPGSALLSTKHNESTLSLDLSDLPESSSPLPKPRATTIQPGQSADQQSLPRQASDASALLSPDHNESTVSLDLAALPNSPELIRPPRPRDPPPPASYDLKQAPRQPTQAYQSLGWDDANPQKASTARPGTGASPQRQSQAGSWDNLQPLFKPPPRVEPPKEPQQPPNDAAAADIMFSAIQSKRYKHEKGTSYKGATFALIPVDRKVRQLLACLPGASSQCACNCIGNDRDNCQILMQFSVDAAMAHTWCSVHVFASTGWARPACSVLRNGMVKSTAALLAVYFTIPLRNTLHAGLAHPVDANTWAINTRMPLAGKKVLHSVLTHACEHLYVS